MDLTSASCRFLVGFLAGLLVAGCSPTADKHPGDLKTDIEIEVPETTSVDSYPDADAHFDLPFTADTPEIHEVYELVDLESDAPDLFELLPETDAQECTELPELPEPPALPGIPGQISPPETVDYSLQQTEDGVTVDGGKLTVAVRLNPFGYAVKRTSDGGILLESSPDGDPTDGLKAISHTAGTGKFVNTLSWGHFQYEGDDAPWAGAAEVAEFWETDGAVWFDLRDDSCRGRLLFVVGPFNEESVRLGVAVSPVESEEDMASNRIAMTFVSSPDERFVGFGERFNSIDQRGRVLRTWAEEGGINPGSNSDTFAQTVPDFSEEWTFPGGETTTYAPIPFFMTNHGYGILADVAYPTHFDLAATHPERLRIAVDDSAISLIIFAGPDPADVLRQYTWRTGRSQVPPPWALAPWNMFLGYSQGNYLDIARTFREMDIPSSVSHVWTNILPFGVSDASVSGLIAANNQLHELGYKSLAYLNHWVDKDKNPVVYEEADEAGYFITDENGDSYVQDVLVNMVNQTKWWVSTVDFTNADVLLWWWSKLQEALDLGFDGFMYDFGEYIPPDSHFKDGHDGSYWHGPFPLIYQRAAYEFFKTLDETPDDGRAPDYLFFHRSAYAGSQQWTWAMWGGDPEADWSVSDGLPASIVGGLNAGLSGMPFWGSDTGGFHAIWVPAPTSELLKRWMQFSAFSGLMRDMTADEIQQGQRIHVLDETDLTAIVRRYQKLRTQLVPYSLNSAWEAHQSGLPLMRHPLLHFPEDPKVWETKRAFLFGTDFYVAPVFTEGATNRTLYLPAGKWVKLWAQSEYDEVSGGFRIGGQPMDGGKTLTVAAPIDEIPLFVRWGALIPLADSSVDTHAPAGDLEDVEVVTADDVRHLLHAWAFPGAPAETTLADGSLLQMEPTSEGIGFLRIPLGGGDKKILRVQALWPPELPAPASVGGLARFDGADPLLLTPGTWTYSETRNAVTFCGLPGQTEFFISTSDFEYQWQPQETCGMSDYEWLVPGATGQVVSYEEKVLYHLTPDLIKDLISEAGYNLNISLPYGSRVYFMRYTTQDRGEIREATAMVGFPDLTPADSAGLLPLPIALFIHPTVGFADKCAPSLGIEGAAEAVLPAASGFIAVAPDLLGLCGDGSSCGNDFHPYLLGEPTAIASLDAVRAAQQLMQQIQSEIPVTTNGQLLPWGASQGGHAALFVHRYAPYYAPEFSIPCLVAVVPPADLVAQSEVVLQQYSSASGMGLGFLLASWLWYEPAEGLDTLLNAAGPKDYTTWSLEHFLTSCSSGKLVSGANSLEDLYSSTFLTAVSEGGFDSYSPWSCFGRENSLPTTSVPLGSKGTDILWVMGENDELVNSSVAHQSLSAMCDQGYRIRHLECAGKNHSAAALESINMQLEWALSCLAGTGPADENLCLITAPQECAL
jgi:sulfoquinovosidase